MRMDKGPDRLILASASPRRSELLERMGLVFECCPADVVETEDETLGPDGLVLANAALKARAVATQYPDALVLGADTTVAIGNRILGKPGSMEDAVAMIETLAGEVHTVYTGVTLCWHAAGLCEPFCESSRVRFKALDRPAILDYFTIVNPLDKAGAYGIQSGRERIIESVDGSVENVMGLPTQRLQAWLDRAGFDFRPQLNGRVRS